MDVEKIPHALHGGSLLKLKDVFILIDKLPKLLHSLARLSSVLKSVIYFALTTEYLGLNREG